MARGFYYYNLPLCYLFEEIFKDSTILSIGELDTTTISLILRSGAKNLFMIEPEACPQEKIDEKRLYWDEEGKGGDERERIRFIRARPDSMPIREGVFDLVVSFDYFSPEDRLSLIFKEVKRVLKREGLFIYTTEGMKVDHIREVMGDEVYPRSTVDLVKVRDDLKRNFRCVETLTLSPLLSSVFKKGDESGDPTKGWFAEGREFSPEYILRYIFLGSDAEVVLEHSYSLQIPLSHIIERFREVKSYLEEELLLLSKEKEKLEVRCDEFEKRSNYYRGRLLLKEVLWSKVKGGLKDILHYLREIYLSMDKGGEGSFEFQIRQGLKGVQDLYSLIQGVEGEGAVEIESMEKIHEGSLTFSTPIYTTLDGSLVYSTLPETDPSSLSILQVTGGIEPDISYIATYESKAKAKRDEDRYSLLIQLLDEIHDLNRRYNEEVEKGIESEINFEETKRSELLLKERIREMEATLREKEESLSRLNLEMEEMKENLLAISEGLHVKLDEGPGVAEDLLMSLEGELSKEEMETLSVLIKEELEPVSGKREGEKANEEALKSEVEMLNFELVQRASRLASLESEVDELNKTVEDLTSQVHERDEKITRMEEYIKESEERAAEIENKLQKSIKELKDELIYREMLLKKEEEKRKEEREKVFGYQLELKEREEVLRERDETIHRLAKEKEDILLENIRLKEELLKKEDKIRIRESILDDSEVIKDEKEFHSFEDELIKGLEELDEDFETIASVNDSEQEELLELNRIKEELERLKADNLDLRLEKERFERISIERGERIKELEDVIEAQTGDFERIKNKVREAIDYITDLHSKLEEKERRIRELEKRRA